MTSRISKPAFSRALHVQELVLGSPEKDVGSGFEYAAAFDQNLGQPANPLISTSAIGVPGDPENACSTWGVGDHGVDGIVVELAQVVGAVYVE